MVAQLRSTWILALVLFILLLAVAVAISLIASPHWFGVHAPQMAGCGAVTAGCH